MPPSSLHSIKELNNPIIIDIHSFWILCWPKIIKEVIMKSNFVLPLYSFHFSSLHFLLSSILSQLNPLLIFVDLSPKQIIMVQNAALLLFLFSYSSFSHSKSIAVSLFSFPCQLYTSWWLFSTKSYSNLSLLTSILFCPPPPFYLYISWCLFSSIHIYRIKDAMLSSLGKCWKFGFAELQQ